MNHLRPHKVFDKVAPADRLATICLPQRESMTSMLERAILISLLKIIKPRKIFEFGTYLGEATVNLAANSEATIHSLDLGEDHLGEAKTKLDELEFSYATSRLPNRLAFQDTQYEKRIVPMLGDSTTFDFSPYFHQFDFIVIDGGHQIEVVRSDTQQAFKMLHQQSPGCIVWHDYGDPRWQITEYLDDLSKELDLYHVSDTAYVFYLNNCDLTFSSE
ncbi:MAG: class I SAM-dependent methyltransferase [Thermodesulfobacteriota bacterium]